MTVEQDLLAELPDILDGVPLGFPDFPGWRFYVQAAVTPAGSTLPFLLGTSILGGPRWQDLSKAIQGISWERGGQPASRPIAGEMTFRLYSTNYEYAPWVNSYYGPGTLIRVLVSNGVDMAYCFTGLTQSWNEDSEGLEAYMWATVTVWETQFLLNEVDDNALLTSVGAGETLSQRISRLATHVVWQYDVDVVSTSPATLQATDLSQDVATEAYLTVDSVDAVLWAGKDGTLKVRDRATGNGTSWNATPPKIATANDDDRLISSVALARVGGAEVDFVNVGVAGRYKTRTTKRDGLITVAEALDADLQRVADAMLDRSDETYRPLSFPVNSEAVGDRQLLIYGDLTDRVTIERVVQDEQRLVFSGYAICGFKIGVMYKDGGTYWSGTIQTDIEAGSAWDVLPPIMRWDTDFWDSGRVWGP